MKTLTGTTIVNRRQTSSSSIMAKEQAGNLSVIKNQAGSTTTDFEASEDIAANVLLGYDGTPILDADGNYILIDS
jgi:hypothetical protein